MLSYFVVLSVQKQTLYCLNLTKLTFPWLGLLIDFKNDRKKLSFLKTNNSFWTFKKRKTIFKKNNDSLKKNKDRIWKRPFFKKDILIKTIDLKNFSFFFVILKNEKVETIQPYPWLVFYKMAYTLGLNNEAVHLLSSSHLIGIEPLPQTQIF